MVDRGRFRGALLGLAIGDAVGASVKFSPRGSFAPVIDMLGGGPFRLEAGRWTDDTSMALCLAESLIERRGMDLKDQMTRYVEWYRRGLWSSKGYCFDIGNATRAALERFEETGDPVAGATGVYTAGNGSIMRLAPVVLYFAHDRQAAHEAARESSRTTHQAEACLKACAELAGVIWDLLRGKRSALSYRSRDEIRGSGYVVESLEAAYWAFDTAARYEEAVLNAANLGEDADTTSAITGQMAGAYYGIRGIPPQWRDRCHRAAEIIALADQLYELAPRP
ncbi:MAG: ADP-ribosylglycohydrolase family protein [Bryobacter sp.]|jgi:ADP-ribosyl-[dinitrogen reductase] hydrolase|nr:ADP-ribosylglycohydrolase family protein [Bryobacter sp. CoA8 C33]